MRKTTSGFILGLLAVLIITVSSAQAAIRVRSRSADANVSGEPTSDSQTQSSCSADALARVKRFEAACPGKRLSCAKAQRYEKRVENAIKNCLSNK